MEIVIAGASGFLGTHLTDHLRSRGHGVTRLVRREGRTSDESSWDPYAGLVDRDLIEQVDVVVNVAGSPTAGNPHSRTWARQHRESRVATTRTLAEAIARSDRKPAFLAQTAVGWYGDHGDEVITEESESRGDSLLTQTARAWQDAAEPAADSGVRLCLLRTAIVMDKASPPLKQMRLAFRLGLGSRLGSGTQFFPIVSLRDWLAAATFLAEHDAASGPFNVSCPRTPTNAELTEALARTVHRPALLVAPATVLKMAAGPMAPELLGSLDVRPAALTAAGHAFADTDVDAVLASALA